MGESEFGDWVTSHAPCSRRHTVKKMNVSLSRERDARGGGGGRGETAGGAPDGAHPAEALSPRWALQKRDALADSPEKKPP